MMFLFKKKIHEHEQRFSTNKNPLSIANCTKRKKGEKKLDPLAHHLLQVPPYVARLHEVICAEKKKVLRMLKNVNKKRKD